MSDLIKIHANLWLQNDQLIWTGSPNSDDESHNCDAMGCNSIEHVVRRENLPIGFTESAIRGAVLRELYRQERLAERWS
jgi:hypothetical protein